MSTQIKMLETLLHTSQNIVFFGGAGVSTASGIPDFRSENGLFSKAYAYPPEVMLSRSFYDKHTEEFFKFYRETMLVMDAEPNAAHRKLTELEQAGKLRAVITQNIDGLHQKAGTKNVLELHGSIWRNYCQKCKRSYTAETIQQSSGIPTCSCGGTIKPDVVLYEEMLNQETWKKATNAVEQADLLIVGGTSLTVYPAALFVEDYTGKHLVILNQSPTPQDHKADLVCTDNIADIFQSITI